MRILKSKKSKIIFSVLLLILAAAVVRFVVVPCCEASRYQPQEGDILFQSIIKSDMVPQTDMVRLIEGATNSPYSHCGVVVKKKDEWYVCEAMVFGVKEIPLWMWVSRGERAKYDVYRLKDDYRQHLPQFLDVLKSHLDKPYDWRYRMDDESLYCSELVYKAFKESANEELGETVRLGDLDWEPYRETIVKYEKTDPPLDRLIITPAHLSRATQLEKIFSNGM
jgi:uncharacterized protein YycO